MNKSLRISISVFLIVFSKVILDIALVSTFFEKINDEGLFKIILYTIVFGFVIIHLFNILQRLYPFIISTLFVYFVLCIQFIIFYGQPALIDKDYMLTTIPGFVIVGNVLLFLLFKGMSLRISNENFSISDKIVNLSKHAGLLIGALFLVFMVLKQNLNNIAVFYSVSLIAMLIGFFYLTDLILNIKNCNNIIDNQQVVRFENKIRKLLSDRFFIILTLTACVIAIAFTLSFQLFTIKTLDNHQNGFKYLVRVFGFFTVLLAVLGLVYELFLRQKMILYLGIKNVIRMLPIFLILFASIFFINNYTSIFSSNSDWNFIFLITTIFLMVFVHFSFESITMPTTYAFYLPISIETRHDYYTKSFMLGIFAGMCIATLLTYKLLIKLPYTLIQILPFAIIGVALVLYYINSIPVYKNYRNKLQQFLDIQSRKILVNLGLFKDIENNNIDEFKGIQFVRYINLLYLTNPTLARQAIRKSINSENNLIQRVSLIKAGEIFMLDSINDLFSIKNNKYFPSSPNRDTIDAIITRFLEVSNRMKSKHYVEQLSISKDDDERVFGAKLVYYTSPEEKPKIINRLLKDANLPVVINAIISSQGTEKINLIKSITAKLNSPALGNAAYSTLLCCGNIVLPIVEESFYETGQSEKVQLRIIQLFGDFANEEATDYLLKKLNISNQNINSATLSSLSRCSLTLPEDKTTMLKHELEELCQILVWNMSLLVDINNDIHSDVLKKAMQIEVDNNYESIFNLLSLLYNAKSIKLIRNNLFSNDFEKITFAIELASVLLKDEIKLLILPLLQPITYEERLAFMQDQIPTESLSKRDVLYTILQRDSKWMNQWTKACAMSELSKEEREIDIPILLANMINPDPMLAELAANSVYKLDKAIYFENKAIFGQKYTSLFDQTILTRIEKDTKLEEDFPVLKYEIINYLHGVNEFSSISGEILKKLTDYILPVEIKMGEVIEQIENIDIHNYFYILYSGRTSLFANDSYVKSFNEGSFISSLDLLPDEKVTFTLVSDQDSILYRISSYGFIELLTLYDLIPETIVRKTDNKKLYEYEDFIKRRRILNAPEKFKNKLINYSQN